MASELIFCMRPDCGKQLRMMPFLTATREFAVSIDRDDGAAYCDHGEAGRASGDWQEHWPASFRHPDFADREAVERWLPS